MARKSVDPSKNLLYYGDNLDVLRENIQSESVDLVYLDPPFNSNRAYSVLFKEKSGAWSLSGRIDGRVRRVHVQTTAEPRTLRSTDRWSWASVGQVPGGRTP